MTRFDSCGLGGGDWWGEELVIFCYCHDLVSMITRKRETMGSNYSVVSEEKDNVKESDMAPL